MSSETAAGDPCPEPRAKNGRAPDVFASGRLDPMREYRDDEAVDFAIVGTGAGGGTLAARLAEKGFSVVAFDAGPFFRPLEDFASDETAQDQLYWTDQRDRRRRQRRSPWAARTAARRWAAPPCTSPWCRCASGPNGSSRARMLGYGADWPLDWREMWDYYRQAEQALSISGPVTYPWGPKRPRYPYRAHPSTRRA